MKKVILFILILASLVGCGKKQEEEKPIRPITYQKVHETTNVVKRGYAGTVKSEALSNLSFRVSGTMIRRNVDIGDKVKEGEILAAIDPIEYEIKYQQAIADLQKGKAVLADAKANFERNEILYLENSVSKAQYQSSLANYQSSVSTVDALTKQVEYSKVQLGYTKLVAPMDGTIGSIKTEVNQSVTPQSVVFTLNSAGDQYIEFNVSETIIPLLSIGEKVQIVVESLNNLKLEGEIRNIGTVGNSFGNTYPIKVTIKDPNQELRVGMTTNVYVDIELGGNTKENMIVVPIATVMKDSEGRPYVYVVTDIENGVGISKRKYIELGIASNLGMEVKSGLDVGDYLITMGMNRLQDGEKVRVSTKGGE